MLSMKRLIAIFLIIAGISASAVAVDLRYVDAEDLTVVNRAQERDTTFARLNAANYPELPAKVAEYSNHSTGLAVAFRTDSRNIGAKWTTSSICAGANRTLLSVAGLDLYILRDGKWIAAGVGKPTDPASSSATLVASMDGEMHDCLLYLPLWAKIETLEIGVDDGAVIEPLPNPFGPRVVFMGSSITHGASAGRPGLTYPSRIQRATGWEIPNLGYSGLCKLEPFYARIVADTDADAFVFDGFSNPKAEEIDARLQEFVDIIRAAKPGVPLIFIQTEVRETGNFDLKKRDFEARKRAASRAGMKRLIDAGYRDIYFVDPGMPLADDHDDNIDGIHPTDAGFQRISNHLLPVLRSILFSYGIE